MNWLDKLRLWLEKVLKITRMDYDEIKRISDEDEEC
jgi:hypothetical protein